MSVESIVYMLGVKWLFVGGSSRLTCILWNSHHGCYQRQSDSASGVWPIRVASRVTVGRKIRFYITHTRVLDVVIAFVCETFVMMCFSFYIPARS